MFKPFSDLRISLAVKCQLAFGAAVVLVIAAALYVPWKRIEGLIQDVNLRIAHDLAIQAILEHVERQTQLEAGSSLPMVAVGLTTRPSVRGAIGSGNDYVWPRLILLHGPKPAKL